MGMSRWWMLGAVLPLGVEGVVRVQMIGFGLPLIIK